MMEIQTIIAIIIPVIALPIIGTISFFLKGLFKSVKCELTLQSKGIAELTTKFSEFQLTTQKVFSDIKLVEKDLERANLGVEVASKLSLENEKKLDKLDNKLKNTNTSLISVVKQIDKMDKKVDELEKVIIKINKED